MMFEWVIHFIKVPTGIDLGRFVQIVVKGIAAIIAVIICSKINKREKGKITLPKRPDLRSRLANIELNCKNNAAKTPRLREKKYSDSCVILHTQELPQRFRQVSFKTWGSTSMFLVHSLTNPIRIENPILYYSECETRCRSIRLFHDEKS